MKTILLTGVSGFVGARILRQLGDSFRFVTLTRELVHSADREGILSAVQRLRPDGVIHTAAISDVGYSQEHPEESYRANVMLTLCLAEAARSVGAKLVSFSSDQVYSGERGNGPFDELLDVHPANVYGRHKLEAERRALETDPDSVHLRATWMYDLPGYGLPIRGNLLINLVQAALAGTKLSFSDGEYRGITYVRQAVELLVSALELPGGVYNFGSENSRTMYDTAVDFAQALGLRMEFEKGGRQRSLAMDCGKLRKAGISFDDTQAGLRRCLKDYGLGQ